MNPPHRPGSCRELFLAFTWLALQGFGGVLAVVQRELVDRRQWLTREQFVEDWALAQLMPGPNVVNLSMMIGDRYFGPRGALAALAGMLTAPLAVVLLVAVLWAQVAAHPVAQSALRGMGAVSAGLVMGAGLRLMGALRTNPMGPVACALFALTSFVLVAWLRWPLTAVLPLLGLLACGWAWWRLGASVGEPPA
ncbi:chromate transporter [Hydrogenophaga sp. IBVHS2]|uniref:chromate transporter n=1 Tax=Hydrogenophaga sp. IBVHS2 TaxID=1985170 RepID=UPI000A2ED1F6|nr:chromate transporter [Hydrogenophaga sp. IBVHS2]OSZ66033.1 chromate transporter [Hydrogenophaga sp. IBVHS2]